MLFAIAAILFLVWLLALAFKVTVWVVHVALIAAIVLFILGFVRGRTSTPTTP